MGKLNLIGKRVLVTGGDGYMGKHLVTALRKMQANIFIMDKDIKASDNDYKIDITDRNAVKQTIQKIQPEIVFHLAALLNRERNFDHFDLINNVNHNGTLNLLLALRNIPYHNFIFTSTSEIYGSNKPPFTEKQTPKPVSPYSLTKLNAENLIQNFSTIYNKPFTILRVFNFFGKDMPTDFFIPQLIKALKNEPVFEMTEGEQKRDFLYIDDVIQVLILSAENRVEQNEIFNVCSGQATTLKQLVSEINKQLNSNCKIKFGALPYRENEIWNMVGDNTKIKNELGFKVKNNLKDAIGKLVSN